MQRRTLVVLTSVCSLVWLIAANNSWTCGQNSSPVFTNLPTLGGEDIDIFALSSSGVVGGYSGLPGDNVMDAVVYNSGTPVDLGTLGGDFAQVQAINSSGVAVGYSFTFGDAAQHAFIYTNGPLHDLGTLGGMFSMANAINDAGQIAGTANVTNDTAQHAFLYSGGVMNDLGTLGGNNSSGVAINSSGVVIGDSRDINGNKFGFIYANGQMKSVGDLGSGSYSSARAINDAGAVVGESSTAGGQICAFYYYNGTITNLGDLGSGFSSASAINNAGQVIGTSYNALFQQHGFIASNGVMTDLNTLGGPQTTPFGINNSGQVVGESQDATSTYHAFLWQNGVMTDLNTFIDPNSGWVLASAQGINDKGRIVGFGYLSNNFTWFILDLSGGTPANTAPVAVITPAEQTVNCQTSALLNGGNSTDADGDVLIYQWTENGTVLGTNSTLLASLGLGDHTITLTVTDPCDASSQTNAVIHVVDTNAPVIIGGPAPVTVPADANCQGAVPNVVSGIVASDNCTPTNLLVITQDPAAGAMLGLGQHQIIVTVKDGSGNTTQGSTYYTVVDGTPPVITGIAGPLTSPADANCSAIVPNVVPSVIAGDNCTPVNQLVVTQDPVAGSVVSTGPHSIFVTVKDLGGNTATAKVSFTVVDTTAPVISSVPGPLTVPADANCSALVPNVLPNVVVSDNCTPLKQLILTQNPAPGTVVGTGPHTIVVTAQDASGNTSTANVSLTVRDATPPVIQSLSVSPNSLSPPNHRMVPVTVSVVTTDGCDPAPVSKILSITCNEATSPGEMAIKSDLVACVAATRNGGGNGRVYTITVQCTDNSGNCSKRTVTVTVPH